eukprot:Nitzschia sp. Nitz4//scaffold325_size20118//15997//16815//NITZ4_008705-RA/size20118-processed-gene-0.26-mRNA-1//1//CDS//3329547908//8312//frame0
MASRSQSSVGGAPRDIDVMCGRGGLSNKHPGNRLFRRLVDSNKQTYAAIESPRTKRKLVESIILAIHDQGGQFVKQMKGEWGTIPAREAFVKTAQALREQVESRGMQSSSSDLDCQSTGSHGSSCSKKRISLTMPSLAHEQSSTEMLEPLPLSAALPMDSTSMSSLTSLLDLPEAATAENPCKQGNHSSPSLHSEHLQQTSHLDTMNDDFNPIPLSRMEVDGEPTRSATNLLANTHQHLENIPIWGQRDSDPHQAANSTNTDSEWIDHLSSL